MKILKRIVLALAILIAIPLIVALFTKSEYAVEREVVINKPKQEVFNFIKEIKNQDQFSKWAMADPNMKKEYRGTDGTEGFVSAWDSETQGKGEQEIKKITEGEKIDLELRFIKPFESKANVRMLTESVSENQTKVKWGLESKMMYPMNILLLCMDMDDMLGKDLAAGLANLKIVLEKK